MLVLVTLMSALLLEQAKKVFANVVVAEDFYGFGVAVKRVVAVVL